MSESKPQIEAATAVVSRLMQMRQHWEDAAEAYFDPPRFHLSLQSCITVSRTVTFILQANKDAVPNFEQWYAPFQAQWAADPIMRWAKDSRNTIEKRGDLATLSQVKATIIASYMEGPATDWIPQALFSSPRDFWRGVPRKFMIPHVVENGSLLIERRWIESNLPDVEVLEGLAHVYGRLVEVVTAFLNAVGLPTPPLLDEARPPPMAALAMDRAIYLSMLDGSQRGMRLFRRAIPGPDEKQAQQIEKRYGIKANWKGIEKARTLKEIADFYFRHARIVMKRDGYHQSFAFFLKGHVVFRVIATEHEDRACRYVLMRDLAKLAAIDGADGVILISEVWTAHGDNLPKSGFAADAKVRGEAIALHAANASGETVALEAAVTRRRSNTKKVKEIGPTIDDTGYKFILMPFLIEWGCLDEQALREALETLDRMGIETPRIMHEPDEQ